MTSKDNGDKTNEGTSDTETSSPKGIVTKVGHASAGSEVELSTLRELYLPKQMKDRIINEEDDTVIFQSIHSYPPVKRLRPGDRKRILVTGGAGFVGSHLVDRLMLMGHEVIVLDNFFTGSKRNVQHWIGHPHFELVRHDVVDPFMIEVSQIYHLACPASPPHYQYNPTKTVKTSVMGTINMLGLAKRTKARFLLTSTSGKKKRKTADELSFSFCHLQREREIWSLTLKSPLMQLSQRSMVILTSIRRKKPTGATSIPSDLEHVMTKANVLLKL